MGNSMFALPELRQLAKKMRQSGLSSIEISGCHYRLRLKYDDALPVAEAFPMITPPATAALASPDIIRAPMPGTVLLSHPLNGVPFTTTGAEVQKDDLLALIRVGLIYLPVRTPTAGTIIALMVEHEERVEYDSALFTLCNSEHVA